MVRVAHASSEQRQRAIAGAACAAGPG